jgi:Co/Zn/Cd efflux system component
VFHEGLAEDLSKKLKPLNFGSEILSSESITDEEHLQQELSSETPKDESSVLMILLAINGIMFIVEIVLGWISDSAGLIADSLDMLGDSAVYAISLYAVGHSIMRQKRAAHLSGYIQMFLAAGLLVEVLRKFHYGSEPNSPYMLGVATLALVANVTCMALLFRHRGGGAHMKASWIFSTNDVIANCGLILAAILVYFTNSNIPDLVIGAIIGVVVLRGAFAILKISRIEKEPCC